MKNTFDENHKIILQKIQKEIFIYERKFEIIKNKLQSICDILYSSDQKEYDIYTSHKEVVEIHSLLPELKEMIASINTFFSIFHIKITLEDNYEYQIKQEPDLKYLKKQLLIFTPTYQVIQKIFSQQKDFYQLVEKLWIT